MHLPTFKLPPVCALALLAAAGTARADLVVNEDIGSFGFGTVSRSGTTLGAANNASNYVNANDTFTWLGEFVYQFTTTQSGVLELASDDLNGIVDNDYFLLTGLTTGDNDDPGGVSPEAKDVLGGERGRLIETSGSFGLVDAGTYFLSVDSFEGAEGIFNFDLTLSEFVPPMPPGSTLAMLGGALEATIDAGEVLFYEFDYDGALGTTIDTFGSGLDTELGLYDANGFLVAFNDDAVGLESELTLDGLDAGTYYLAAGLFNTLYADGFDATSISTDSGTLTINGLSAVAAVPEPGTTGLIAAAALGLLARRRRRTPAVV